MNEPNEPTDYTATLESAPISWPPFAQVRELSRLIEAAQAPIDLPGLDVLAIRHRFDERLELLDLEQYRATPHRKSGNVMLADVGSFVGYVNAHAMGQATTIYRRLDSAHYLAVLNGHERGEGDRRDDSMFVRTLPGWGDFRAELTLKHSTEWSAWSGISGKFQGQEEFAQFLEAHAREVRVPDAATLIELAGTIEGTSSAEFGSSVRLDNGARGFTYRETVNATAGRDSTLELFRDLELGLRVFTCTDPIKVTARFRYRLNGGKLSLGIELDRPDTVLEFAIKEIDTIVEAQTGHVPMIVSALP